VCCATIPRPSPGPSPGATMMLQPCMLLSLAAPSLAAPIRDWPQMGRTPSHESYKNASIPAEPPHAEWTFTGAKDRLVASPALWGGTVYLGSDDGHLYAVTQHTGKLLWSFKQKCMPAHSPLCGSNGIRSSPAVDTRDGSIAFGSYDGHAYKVSSKGELMWAFKTEGKIYSPATIDSEGTVYVGTMRPDNCLYALHGDTQAGASAQLKWKACGKKGIRAGEMNSGAAIGSPGGPAEDVVVMNNFDGVVRAFSRQTGKLLWAHQDSGTGGGGSATIAGRTVFIGSWDRHLYALDALTGKVNWAFNASGEIESMPAFLDGVVYLSAEESLSTWALDASTGRVIWMYSGATLEFNGSPTLGDTPQMPSWVSVGANDGYMHVLARATGKLLFKLKTACGEESHVFSSAAVGDNGMMYYTCNTGTARRRRLQKSVASSSSVMDHGFDAPGVGIAYAADPKLHMSTQ
jgi:outer membrane protein assembly factor BamB